MRKGGKGWGLGKMLYTSTKVRWKYRAGIEHLKMKGVDIGRLVTIGYVTWIYILPHLCMESHHQRGLGVEQQAQSRSPGQSSNSWFGAPGAPGAPRAPGAPGAPGLPDIGAPMIP